jgi:hypothetical protein
MEILFIIWPFVLLIAFFIYGWFRYNKENKNSNFLFSKVKELNGSVSRDTPIKQFFKNYSVVFGYTESNGNLDFICSFNKNAYSICITYVERYVGWPVVSTVIIFESSDFSKMNFVVSNESLSGFSHYVRGLQKRNADVFVWCDSGLEKNNPASIKYNFFLKDLFELHNNVKVDFYDGRMTIVIGQLLKSNRLNVDEIFSIINRFFASVNLSKV